MSADPVTKMAAFSAKQACNECRRNLHRSKLFGQGIFVSSDRLNKLWLHDRLGFGKIIFFFTMNLMDAWNLQWKTTSRKPVCLFASECNVFYWAHWQAVLEHATCSDPCSEIQPFTIVMWCWLRKILTGLTVKTRRKAHLPGLMLFPIHDMLKRY
jgi:hypothetical protein